MLVCVYVSVYEYTIGALSATRSSATSNEKHPKIQSTQKERKVTERAEMQGVDSKEG